MKKPPQKILRWFLCLNLGKFVILELQPIANVDAERQQSNGNFGDDAAVFITDKGIVTPDINDSTDHRVILNE